MNRIGIVSLVGYISTIFAANWAINRYGIVPVGFGLVAPAGVFFAGMAFTFRDVTQRFLGLPWVVLAIVVGAGCSWFVSPRFALASAVAFGTSELLDLAIYTPLERRSFVGAVAASNAAGLVVDSWLFLMLAFGSPAFIAGQIVGKAWMTLAALPLVYGLRRVRFA